MTTGTAEGDRGAGRTLPRPKLRLSPVGFWSYSRRDDELSRGRLSQLRSLLLAELQTQYGRDGIQLFQDVSAIPHGADWERLTTGAIEQSTFFIPIVTPFYMQSQWCARETKMFAEREREIFETHPDLSRDRRRVFPLLWIDVSEVEPIDEQASAALQVAQWCDFSRLRHRNLERDEEVLAAVAAFAKSIVDVLQLRVEAPLSSEERERIAREAEEARLRAEAESRRRKQEEARETERRREREEAAARSEVERLALERDEAQRLAAEQRAIDEEARRERAGRLGAPLRSPMLWLLAGIPLAVWLAISLMPGFGGGGERPAAVGAPLDPPVTTADSQPAAAAPAPPAIDWLFKRWCVGGNRSNVQSIDGDRSRIVVSFAGGRQPEAVRRIEEGVVTTEIARYVRQGDSLVIDETGRQQRLERCE